MAVYLFQFELFALFPEIILKSLGRIFRDVILISLSFFTMQARAV